MDDARTPELPIYKDISLETIDVRSGRTLNDAFLDIQVHIEDSGLVFTKVYLGCNAIELLSFKNLLCSFFKQEHCIDLGVLNNEASAQNALRAIQDDILQQKSSPIIIIASGFDNRIAEVRDRQTTAANAVSSNLRLGHDWDQQITESTEQYFQNISSKECLLITWCDTMRDTFDFAKETISVSHFKDDAIFLNA